MGFPDGSASKESACKAGDPRDASSTPGQKRSPGVGKWQPTPVLFGKSHGRRSLVGYSPYGRKESDTTEVTQHAHTQATVQASYRTLNCSTQQQTSRSLLESGNI